MIFQVNRICVITSRARAYYALVSRLRRADLPFSSVVPGSDHGDCELVLTTAAEVGEFCGRGIALEELDENPGVFKGQILSRLVGDQIITIGVDPGKRTGLAVFHGQTKLAFNTFNSSAAVCSKIGAFARGVPSSRMLVRVGNGNRSMAARLVDALGREVPGAIIEMVDESGTSAGSSRMKGVQRHQVAAARIAFRKGVAINVATTRTRG